MRPHPTILRSFLFLVFLIFYFHSFAQTAAILRGPYLNVGTSESVIIRWRTDAPVKGKVWYGSSVASLNDTVSGPVGTEHEITLSGLSADTDYFYGIGSDSLQEGGTTDYYFRTSPPAGVAGRYRFWAIGDFGNGSPAQFAVKESYKTYNSDTLTHGWIWLGDNAYGDGTDAEYQTNVFEVYPEMLRNTVVWPAPGNHDYKSIDDITQEGPYYDIFSMPTAGEAGGLPSGREMFYSFDYGNIHFISLLSEYLPWVLVDSGEMIDWLKDDLAATTADWIVAYWHQPPYSKSSHDSDDLFSLMSFMRTNVVSTLEDYGVDLVLTGHSHGYERSYLINGHYGNSGTFNAALHIVDGSSGKPADGTPFKKYKNGTNAGLGAVYNVVGCSGALSSGASLDHPAMYYSTQDYHGSLVIDVYGDTLTCVFLDTNATVRDEYQIIKKVDTSVFISSQINQIPLEAFPNPTSGTINLEFSIPQPDRLNIEMTDLSGKVSKLSKDQVFPAGTYALQFDLEEFPAGIYQIRVKGGQFRGFKRIVIE